MTSKEQSNLLEQVEYLAEELKDSQDCIAHIKADYNVMFDLLNAFRKVLTKKVTKKTVSKKGKK